MKNNEIRNRQYMSDLIDLIICFFPAILSYHFAGLKNNYENIGIFELMAIIYLLYFTLVFVFNKGNSIGNSISKITLVNVNNGKKSVPLNLWRAITFTIILFLIPEVFENNYLFIVISLLLLLPIRFTKKEFVIFSLINFGLHLTFVSLSSNTLINNK